MKSVGRWAQNTAGKPRGGLPRDCLDACFHQKPVVRAAKSLMSSEMCNEIKGQKTRSENF